MKTPISLIIDDAAPVVSVYYTHAGRTATKDGRPLAQYYPNSLFFRFCDIAERYGLRGKFSVVPMPGNLGSVDGSIEGVSGSDLSAWLEGVKQRLCPASSVCPEMLTHNFAVDLATGAALPLNEQEWASDKDRTVLEPYIAKALSVLHDAGLDPTGVTSPWMFGIEVEDEYAAAISEALLDAAGRKTGWFFLRIVTGRPKIRPWIEVRENGRTLVAIPATTHDRFWCTIDDPRTGPEFVSSLADRLISKDGKSGDLIDVLDTGGWPVILTHWQSLMSNGLGTGLSALEETARRIEEHLSDRVEWRSFASIAETVAASPEDFPKPDFAG